MVVFKNLSKFDTSNVEFNGGKLIKYEKGAKNRSMQHIDYGLSFFEATVFRQSMYQSNFDLSDVCHKLATQGNLEGFEVFERFYEIGSIQGIEDFSSYLREVRL
jgi:hypothetical protein